MKITKFGIGTLLLTILSLSATIFTGCNRQPAKHPVTESYVLVISLDGFRWDYPELYHTPNLDSIARYGVRAKSLISCYPSKTFPNHYSIATGLHPNHHGIVNNSFYDKQLGFYRLGDRTSIENGKFYGGEPIWNTAEKQGIRTASYYWVGSEADIQGMHPSYWKRYNQNIPFEQRIDTVIRWFTLPENKRPHLVLFYYHEPDHISHRHGPISRETQQVVESLDSLIGIFTRRLSALPIADKLNIIILSDHGMTEISPDRVIDLSAYLNPDDFSYITGSNPVYSLQPKSSRYNEVLEKLRSIPKLNVWERNEIPSEYRYGTNPRINDILIEANPGWSISWGKSDNREKSYTGGTHGYNHLLPDMQGIFYAIGPAFRKGYVHPSFQNVNIYPLIARLLNLNAAPTDGNSAETEPMLTAEKTPQEILR